MTDWSRRQPKVMYTEQRGELGIPGSGFDIILEQPPHYQLVYFKNGDQFLVPLPWMYYRVVYVDSYEIRVQDDYYTGLASTMVSHILCAPKRFKVKEMTHDARACRVPLPNMLGTAPCHNAWTYPEGENPNAMTAAGRLAICSLAVANLHGQSSNTEGSERGTLNWKMIHQHLGVKKHSSALASIKAQMKAWSKLSIDETLALPWVYDTNLASAAMSVIVPQVGKMPKKGEKGKVAAKPISVNVGVINYADTPGLLGAGVDIIEHDEYEEDRYDEYGDEEDNEW